MIEGEVYVLRAARDILRKKLGLQDNQCNCEPDGMIPVISSDLYYAVIPSTIEPGRVQQTSGGVHDLMYGFEVMVVQRALRASDQKRHVFLEQLYGLNHAIGRVIRALDWQLDFRSLVNALMYEDLPDDEPFIAQPILRRVDAKPRMVTNQIYENTTIGGKATTPFIGLARSVHFGGIRRIQTVAQLTNTDTVTV